jgi:hypothetical protein
MTANCLEFAIPVVAGFANADKTMEIVLIPNPDYYNNGIRYNALPLYELNRLDYRVFKETVDRLKNQREFSVLKKIQKYVTHLKLAYLEHILIEIAMKRLKDAALGQNE